MSGSSPASVMREIGCASPPAQIRQVRAGASLRGVERRFLAYAFPPRSPHPRRLAVPTRHGFVRAACHPLRHLPEQAAPSFTAPLRRDGGEVGVGPERPACRSAGGFLRPALRTGRATLTASGAPRIPLGPRGSCRRGSRPWCRDAVAPPAIAGDLHPLRDEQRDPSLGGPPAGFPGQVAATQSPPVDPGMLFP